MKFVKVNHIVVFGGSLIVLEFLKLLKKKKINFHYFTNKRQLSDNLTNNLSLRKNLKKNNIKFFETEDINKNKLIKKIFTSHSLGVGFGQPWVFKSEMLKLMNPNLVDFMGIPMPKYRGGAHYTWMILNQNFVGGCFIQSINKNTVQSELDSGQYYDYTYYKYPKNLKNPKDFFNYSVIKEINFLKKFLKKITSNTSFKLKKLDEKNSVYFPRLVSKFNSYINWNYDIDELVRFINAFSDPYPGAATFLKNKKVYLKNAQIFENNNFHSYGAGIITNIFKKKLLICAKGGIIIANYVLFENKKNIDNIKIGERLTTNIKYLEMAKNHRQF